MLRFLLVLAIGYLYCAQEPPLPIVHARSSSGSLAIPGSLEAVINALHELLRRPEFGAMVSRAALQSTDVVRRLNSQLAAMVSQAREEARDILDADLVSLLQRYLLSHSLSNLRQLMLPDPNNNA